MNALNKVHEPRGKIQLYKKLIQGLIEYFTQYLPRLSRALAIKVPETESSKILIEFLAHEKTTPQCKQIIRPLKIRLSPLDK